MRFQWFGHIAQDLGFATRCYRKRPGFAVLAALTLAFGIGAATAVYSVVHAVLLRPLPFARSESLVMVWDNAPQDGDRFKAILVSPQDFESYSQSSHTLDRFSSAGRIRPTLHRENANHVVLAGLVTAGMFRDTLVTRAQIGRTFTDEDQQSGCVVVLAHRFWTRTFGADVSVAGRNLRFDESTCTVVGIMPSGFDLFPIRADMWFLRGHAPSQAVEAARRGGWLDDGIVYARLTPGSTVERAEKELTELHKSLHGTDRSTNRSELNRVAAVVPIRSAMTSVTAPSLQRSLWLLFAAVGLLLLIACGNVANLFLARLADRQQEFAVRAALGSGRGRLIRQLMTEGLLLAVAGTATGILLAWVAVRWFRQVNPFELPTQAGDVGLNPRVLLFAAGLSVITTLVFTAMPAITGSNLNLIGKLHSGGRGLFGRNRRHRLAQMILTAEVALSFALLANAGLLMSSVLLLRNENLGFDIGQVMTVDANLPPARYSTRQSREAFEISLADSLRSIPGVSGVAFGSFPPEASGGEARIEVQGQEVQNVFDVDHRPGSPDYLKLLRVPILKGRSFADPDRSGPPIAIVSQRLVDEYFAGADPLGRSIRVLDGDVMGPWRTVVGVIGSWKHMVDDSVWKETAEVLTMGGPPTEIGSRYSISVGVRASGNLAAIGREVQRRITAADPAAVQGEMEVLPEKLAGMTAYARFRAAFLIIFGAGSLLLVAVGLHGVVAQVVAQRIPELALRRAIGASGRGLAWLVVRQGGEAVVYGLGIGVAAAASGGRVIAAFLYGTEQAKLQNLELAAAVLIASAALAIMVPALKAACVDPMRALREE